MPASGQSILAFLLERKRAVAICKNADHKTFVHDNLAKAVKALGLAPDKRQAKPPELARWETTHSQMNAEQQDGYLRESSICAPQQSTGCPFRRACPSLSSATWSASSSIGASPRSQQHRDWSRPAVGAQLTAGQRRKRAESPRQNHNAHEARTRSVGHTSACNACVSVPCNDIPSA